MRARLAIGLRPQRGLSHSCPRRASSRHPEWTAAAQGITAGTQAATHRPLACRLSARHHLFPVDIGSIREPNTLAYIVKSCADRFERIGNSFASVRVHLQALLCRRTIEVEVIGCIREPIIERIGKSEVKVNGCIREHSSILCRSIWQ